MKHGIYLDTRLIHVNVEYMQVFGIRKNFGIMINGDVNANNWFTRLNVMMDLFGILVYVNTNVINYVMLENISITKNCNCRKKLIDKLVAECSEGIDGNKMVRNATLNDYGRVCDLPT